MKEGFNEFENQENIDAKIEDETTKLQNNLDGLRQDIESMGGETALQNKLDRDVTLREALYHKSQRLSWALKGALVFAPAAALGAMGEINTLAHPDYFAAGQFDNISKGFAAMTIVGLIATSISVIEFIKHNRALKRG